MTAARSPQRREALLAATLRLLAAGGADAVTHRAVAREARLANGAVAYYFASRSELLNAAFRRLIEIEVALFRRAFDDLTNTEPAAVADQLAGVIAQRLVEAPDATLARYELFLEAARRPALRPPLAQWRTAYRDLIEDTLRRGGSPTPAQDAPLLLDALNGTLLAIVAIGRQQDAHPRLRQTIGSFLP